MLDSKQIASIVMILTMFFAIPATVVTFVSQSQDDRSDASSVVESTGNKGVSFLDGMSSVITDSNFYYIIALILIITSILFIALLIQKSRENKSRK